MITITIDMIRNKSKSFPIPMRDAVSIILLEENQAKIFPEEEKKNKDYNILPLYRKSLRDKKIPESKSIKTKIPNKISLIYARKEHKTKPI